MTTPEYVKGGLMTVNGTEIEYKVRKDTEQMLGDEFVIEFYKDGEFLGDLPMGEDDCECIHLIDLEETVCCAAMDGLLPDVGIACGIPGCGCEEE